MLSLVCRDALGNKIAECHHVHPQLLWETIKGVFCDYYHENPDGIFMGPGSVISKNGLGLGTAEVVSGEISRNLVMPSCVGVMGEDQVQHVN